MLKTAKRTTRVQELTPAVLRHPETRALPNGCEKVWELFRPSDSVGARYREGIARLPPCRAGLSPSAVPGRDRSPSTLPSRSRALPERGAGTGDQAATASAGTSAAVPALASLHFTVFSLCLPVYKLQSRQQHSQVAN